MFKSLQPLGDHMADTQQKKPARSRGVHAPTVKEIQADRLTPISEQYWAPTVPVTKRKAFDAQIIEDIYYQELQEYNISRVMLLELSHYLEKYPALYYITQYTRTLAMV